MNNQKTIDPTIQVVETLKYVKEFNGTTILIKLGGAALEDMTVVKRLCSDLAFTRAAGISLVIVHGGGKAINAQLKIKGIEWSFHEGQRITTPEMMDEIEMVLAGKSNQALVRTLNSAGLPAVGLTGTDGNLLECVKSNPKLGEVGEVKKVNVELIKSYLDGQKESGKGYIPVIAPIGVGPQGEALNINADWAASKIAQALGIEKLIYMTDQDGILDNEGKLVAKLCVQDLEKQITEGVVTGGMLAKTQTIIDGINNGITQIHIINANRPHSLIEELFTDRGIGTICQYRFE
jgi:acetylglutamate kinase